MKAQTNIISSPTPNPSSSYMLKSKLNSTFKSSLKSRFASSGFHELSHRTAHLKVVKLQKRKKRKPEQNIRQTKQSWVANSKIQNESMKEHVLKVEGCECEKHSRLELSLHLRMELRLDLR